MKKLFKYLIVGTGVFVGASWYATKKAEEKEADCATILASVKTSLADEGIIGTWIDMTAVYHQTYDARVYLGGITTKQATYDFIADAKTKRILVLDKQVRV